MLVFGKEKEPLWPLKTGSAQSVLSYTICFGFYMPMELTVAFKTLNIERSKNIELCCSSSITVAFRIYDMDKDGYISNGELFQVLKMMVGTNLKDTQLQQIVDKTIIFADKDGDGKISFQEFCEVRQKIIIFLPPLHLLQSQAN